MERVNKTERYLNTLPSTHQDMLRRYREHLYRIRDCIEQNSKVIKHLLRNVDSLFSPDDSHTIPSNENHDTVQIEQSKVNYSFKKKNQIKNIKVHRNIHNSGTHVLNFIFFYIISNN